jgi:hypothetical protein
MRRATICALALGLAGCGKPVAPSPSRTQLGAVPLGRPLESVHHTGSTSAPSPAPPRLMESEPVARHQDLPNAERLARTFFGAYVNFIYGREPAADVPGIDPQLRSQLEHRSALTTPAERLSEPRLRRVTVAAAGPPISAIATALVAEERGQYQLTAILEPTHGRWAVVAVDG